MQYRPGKFDLQVSALGFELCGYLKSADYTDIDEAQA